MYEGCIGETRTSQPTTPRVCFLSPRISEHRDESSFVREAVSALDFVSGIRDRRGRRISREESMHHRAEVVGISWFDSPVI